MSNKSNDGLQSPPSGVTAWTAGVLAMLGGTFWAGLAVHTVGDLATTPHHQASNEWLTLAGPVLAMALLWPGSILLLLGKLVGRWLIAIGCSVVIAMMIVLHFEASYLRNIFGLPYFFFGDAKAVFVFTLFPVVTMVLALTPATRRWIQSSP